MLECWRMYIRTTPLSFLVTWYRHRERESAVLLLVQGVHRPLMGKYLIPDLHRTPEVVQGHGLVLTSHHTEGSAEGFNWSFTLTPLAPPLDPLPDQGLLGRLRRRLPWSFRWKSYPLVRFTGRVGWQGREWQGEGWGAVHHCWGTVSPRHWLWLHGAHCFPQNVSAEFALAHIDIGPLGHPRGFMGYLWVRNGRTLRYIHGIDGKLHIRGVADRIRVYATPWHGNGHVLYARTHVRVWKKLAPHIVTTLVGDLRIPDVIQCPGQALVEWGNPPMF